MKCPTSRKRAHWFEGQGKRVLGETRIGAHGTPVFFVHPKDMMGVLTEIMEVPKDVPSGAPKAIVIDRSIHSPVS